MKKKPISEAGIYGNAAYRHAAGFGKRLAIRRIVEGGSAPA